MLDNDQDRDASRLSWIHPVLDRPLHPVSQMPETGALHCMCQQAPVTLAVTAKAEAPHLTAAPGLWRAPGALLAYVAVVPKGALRAERNGDKLEARPGVDGLQPFGCRECGGELGATVAIDGHRYCGKTLFHIEFGPAYQSVAPSDGADLAGLQPRGVSEAVVARVTAEMQRCGLPLW